MGALPPYLRKLSNGLAWWCPGCDEAHSITTTPGGWSWDGSVLAPTFSPSVLTTGGHYDPNFKQGDECWCTFNARHPDNPSSFKCDRCHCFVKDGRIQFLGDCTHALVGQTMPMIPWPKCECGDCD